MTEASERKFANDMSFTVRYALSHPNGTISSTIDFPYDITMQNVSNLLKAVFERRGIQPVGGVKDGGITVVQCEPGTRKAIGGPLGMTKKLVRDGCYSIRLANVPDFDDEEGGEDGEEQEEEVAVGEEGDQAETGGEAPVRRIVVEIASVGGSDGAGNNIVRAETIPGDDPCRLRPLLRVPRRHLERPPSF
jgi:hypothetical protein